MPRPPATGPEDLRGAAPARVRQQSIRYPTGYIQDFDLDIFEHLNVVDSDIPQEEA
jgi:agmatinase